MSQKGTSEQTTASSQRLALAPSEHEGLSPHEGVGNWPGDNLESGRINPEPEL